MVFLILTFEFHSHTFNHPRTRFTAPVFSALGIALSDILYSHSRSAPLPLDESSATLDAISEVLADLEGRVRAGRSPNFYLEEVSCARCGGTVASSRRISLDFQVKRAFLAVKVHQPIKGEANA